MTPFQWRIPRDLARALGQGAVDIIEAGRYEAPSGQTREIRALLEASRAGTTSYPPDHPLPEPPNGAEDTVIEVENTTTLSAARRG